MKWAKTIWALAVDPTSGCNYKIRPNGGGATPPHWSDYCLESTKILSGVWARHVIEEKVSNQVKNVGTNAFDLFQ